MRELLFTDPIIAPSLESKTLNLAGCAVAGGIDQRSAVAGRRAVRGKAAIAVQSSSPAARRAVRARPARRACHLGTCHPSAPAVPLASFSGVPSVPHRVLDRPPLAPFLVATSCNSSLFFRCPGCPATRACGAYQGCIRWRRCVPFQHLK